MFHGAPDVFARGPGVEDVSGLVVGKQLAPAVPGVGKDDGPERRVRPQRLGAGAVVARDRHRAGMAQRPQPGGKTGDVPHAVAGKIVVAEEEDVHGRGPEGNDARP